MVRKVVRWLLDVVNKQNKCPLRVSAGQPVMANAKEGR
jgi:hypothetical protein